MGMYLSTFGTVCLEGPKWRDSLAAREALGSPLFLGLYVVYRALPISGRMAYTSFLSARSGRECFPHDLLQFFFAPVLLIF